MEMCRFKSATDSGYTAFKAALTGYLDNIKDKEASRAVQDDIRGTDQQNKNQRELLDKFDFHERVIRRQQLGEINAKEETFEWVWTSKFKDWLLSSVSLFWIAGKPASGKSTLMDHLSRSKRSLELLESYTNEHWVLVHHFFDYRGRDRVRNNFSGFLRSLLFQLLSQFPEVSAQVKNIKRRELTESHAWSTGEMRIALDTVLEAASKPILLLLDGLDEYAGNKIELANYVKDICSERIKICIASRPDPPFPDAFRTVSEIKMDRLNYPGILACTNETLLSIWDPSDPADSEDLKNVAIEIAQRAKGVFLWARFAVFEMAEGKTRGEAHSELQARLENVPPELEAIYSRILVGRSPFEKAVVKKLLQLLCYAKEAMTVRQIFSAMSISSAQDDPQQHISSFDSCGLVKFRKRMLANAGGIVETFESEERDAYLEFFKTEHMQVIHRTVEFYLERGGWSDLQVADQECVQPHHLWLQVSARILQRTDLKPVPNDRDNFPSLATLDETRLDRLIGSTTGSSGTTRAPEALLSHGSSTPVVGALLWYVLRNLPEHAASFERETQTSSYQLLKGLLSEHYVRAHRLYWRSHTTCDLCVPFRYLQRKMGMKLPDGLCQIAIAHGLLLFFQDCMVARGSSLGATSQISDGPSLAPISPKGKLKSERSRMRGDPELVGITMFAAVAVIERSERKESITWASEKILQICLTASPVVEDVVLRHALRVASLHVIQILLNNGDVPEGRIVFVSNSEHDVVHEAPEDRLESVKPLWEIGKRADDYDNESIVDLFLGRGEKINDQCGPAGTVIHSLVQSVCVRPWHAAELLRTLLRKGAGINAQGPEGRPLEYLWKLANTSQHNGRKSKPYGTLLRDLIDLGAVNKRKDPNGEVPSVDRMYFWPESYSGYEEYKRYYHHGPLPEGWEMRVERPYIYFVNHKTNTTTQVHP